MPKFTVRHVEGETIVTLRPRSPGGPLWYLFSVRNVQTWRSAKTKLERLAREIARREVYKAIDRRAGGMPFEATVKEYLTARWPVPDPSNPSYDDTRYRLKVWTRVFGALDLAAVTDEEIRDLISKHLGERTAAGKSAQTVNSDRLILSTFLRWCMKQRDATGRRLVPWTMNPASRAGLGLPSIKHNPKPPLSDSAVNKLLKVSKRDPIYPLLLLILGAGLRPRGASRTLWANVDLKAGTVETFEKGHVRRGQLSEWARKALAPCARSRGDSDRVCALGMNAVHDRLKAIRSAAGLESGVTLQALRRVAAFKLFQQVPIQVYARLMDHSLSVAQSHYLNFASQTATKGVNRAWTYANGLHNGLQRKRKRKRSA